MHEWTSHVVPASVVEGQAQDGFLLQKRIDDKRKLEKFVEEIKAEIRNAMVKLSLSDDNTERAELQDSIDELKRELKDWESGKYSALQQPDSSYVHDTRSNHFTSDNMYFRSSNVLPSISQNPSMTLRQSHQQQKSRKRTAESQTLEVEKARMRRYIGRYRLGEKYANLSCTETSPIAESFNEEDRALERQFDEAFSEGNLLTPKSQSASLKDLWEAKHQSNIVFSKGLKLPTSIWNLLFPHQQVAIQWLFELNCLKTGGVLADEMGLGKTIEIAGFIGALQYSGMHQGTILIVCPATLLKNWLRELSTWIPMIPVFILHNSVNDGTPVEVVRQAEKSSSILLTTYATLLAQRDLLLSLRRLQYAFLDEGHIIRNYHTQTAQVCHRLPTVHRIISTGTPIQNNLQELWGIFHFAHPALLGTISAFNSVFSEPIRRGASPRASRAATRDSFEYSRQLKARIRPFFLRRLKCDVKMCLYGKTEDIIYVKLSDAQLHYYKSIVSSRKLQSSIERHKIANQIKAPRNSLGEVAEIFRSITYLRKVCNHTWFVKDDVIPKVTRENMEECMNHGAKFRVLFDLIARWQIEKAKGVIYSQSRAVLDLIEKCIASGNDSKDDRNRLNYVRIDGGTAISNRPGLIEALNNDPTVHLGLMTTRVGGLGINLTGCSKVVLFDPDWNAFQDFQARERVWRFGQKKDVTIYRLICSGTIEEKIYHRQLHKLFTVQSVLSSQEINLADMLHFTPEEVMDLFSLGPEYLPDTKHRGQQHGQKTNTTQRKQSDPMRMLKTVFDSNDILRVESFDEIARKIGIDEQINSQPVTPSHVVQERINTLGKVERPKRDEPQLKQ